MMLKLKKSFNAKKAINLVDVKHCCQNMSKIVMSQANILLVILMV